jgi:hypothetical protein
MPNRTEYLTKQVQFPSFLTGELNRPIRRCSRPAAVSHRSAELQVVHVQHTEHAQRGYRRHQRTRWMERSVTVSVGRWEGWARVCAPTLSVHSDVNVAIRVGVSPRPPSSLYTTVLTYTYAAKVWALSVLQGIQFLSPRAKPFSSDSLSAGRWGE